MKKLNSIPYQRNLQTHQEDRNPHSDRLERADKLRQNLKLNQLVSNSEHYRKHNSPDANKLRGIQNQNQLFLSKNYRGKHGEETVVKQDLTKLPSQNGSSTQNSSQRRQLSKTASSPKLVHSNQ